MHKLVSFLVGLILGFIPVVGQIFGLACYYDSESGNEGALYMRPIAFGSGVGTILFVSFFLLYQILK